MICLGKWVFCACNKPLRTYTSLTNEVKLEYVEAAHTVSNGSALSQRSSPRQTNSFKIDYKFVPAEFGAPSGRVRIVQGSLADTSLIGGYNLRLRVPAGHHLRVFGKSARCALPRETYLAKWSNTTTRVTKQLVYNEDTFKRAECTYLFDVAEQHDKNAEWMVSWFLKFDGPLDVHDFEIDWAFIRNQFDDEKRPGEIRLPKETAFDTANEDLVFTFK